VHEGQNGSGGWEVGGEGKMTVGKKVPDKQLNLVITNNKLTIYKVETSH
jgi:hypothetical protein